MRFGNIAQRAISTTGDDLRIAVRQRLFDQR
jgi:hypothetical protein